MIEIRNSSTIVQVRKLSFNRNGVCNFKLVGGGGGAGGYDAGSPGGNGGQAPIITGQISVNQGDEFFVAIGVGGNGAYTGGGASGGPGALGANGARGGNAGPSGSSGAGGGGGGATVLYKLVNGVNTPLVVAGGGGGGGGAGLYSAGAHALYDPVAEVSSGVRQYPTGTTDGAWVSVLNNYSVQNGGAAFLPYEVYFPRSEVYTFTVAADDIGYIYLDGVEFARNFSYGSTLTIQKYVTVGWHEVKYYYTDTGGGPYGVGGRITDASGIEVFNTRMPYNTRTGSVKLTPGGAGQDRGGDGGGGGGGGGGYAGGVGGNVRGGDDGATAGSSGFAFADALNGAYQSTSISLPSTSVFNGAGSGGVSAAAAPVERAGKAGYAAFECMDDGLRTYRNVGGAFGRFLSGFSTVGNVYVRQSNTWNEAKEVYIMKNGQWVRVLGRFDPIVT